jgi:predicted dehydrogenase
MRRIGLIGFGSIAENGHLPALRSFPDLEVTAVADLSPARLDRARALLPGAALYDSPHDLIWQAGIDGVDICTPPGDHADLIVAACARGLEIVVCEKPLVLSEEEYIRIAQARAASGSRVVSVNNWMYSDLNRHVSGALVEGAIGAVRSVELRIGRPDCALGNAGWMPRWRTDLTHAGGGIILDHGWHQLYLLLGWLRLPLHGVSAATRTANPRHYPVEDEASIDLLFPAAHGRIELSWTAQGRTNDGLIEGSDGAITIQDDRVVIDGIGGLQELPFRDKLSLSSYHPNWFEAMLRYNVLDERRDEADRNFAQAGVLVSVIQAAYRSARSHGALCRPTFSTDEMVRAALSNKADMTYVHRSSGSPSA